MQFHASELNKTNQILMELPLFQNLLIEKEELEEQVKMLKHNIMYFESANRKMLRKNEKLKMEIKSMKKKSKKSKVVEETSAGSDSCKATLEDDDDDEVVFIKQEKISKPVVNNTIVIDLCRDDEPAIKMTIDDRYSLLRPITPTFSTNDEEETDEVIDDEGEEVVEVDGEGEGEVEGEEEEVVEGEDETEEVVEVEDEETEEVVEVEGEEETSAGSDSCKATLEEVVEGEDETEEVVEVEEEETEEVVEGEGEETEEVVEGEGEEEDVYEIEINGKTYYVSNEKNSVIYAADEDGEITIEAGVYKNGKPVFN